MIRSLLSLVTALGLIGVAVGQTAPPAGNWKPITKWHSVASSDQAQKIGNGVRRCVSRMIRADNGGSGFSWLYKSSRSDIEFRALQAMALMAAQRYLAKSSEHPNADAALFRAAQLAIDDGMNGAIKPVMPEYWQTIEKDSTVQDRDPYKPGEPETLQQVSSRLSLGAKNYGVGVLLMALEHHFGGGRHYPFDSTKLVRDRSARSVVPLTSRAKLGIARLTALLLVRNARGTDLKAEFEAPLAKGALWGNYDRLGEDVKSSCFSESSSAIMGLRAALSLGVADFEEDAFKFGLSDPAILLEKKEFLKRLSDVLVHSVLCVVDARAGVTDPGDATGILGFDGIRQVDSGRAAEVGAADAWGDICFYDTRYMRSAAGNRIFQVWYDT
jgi:hypothetical protein